LDVYVVHWGEASVGAAMQVAEQCRSKGLRVQMHCGEASLKSQMKKADQSGAQCAVLIGEDERAQAAVTVKPLRAEAGMVQQDRVPLGDAASVIIGLIKRNEKKGS
jgi:histidyl-tRNA synthetase